MMLANERQEVEDAVAFIRMASSGLDFIIFFAMATCMGMVLNYSVYLCTATNSALTTAMVGSVKNMLAAFVGMAFSDDYVFRLNNIIGIHITILGASCYTYVKYRETTAASYILAPVGYSDDVNQNDHQSEQDGMESGVLLQDMESSMASPTNASDPMFDHSVDDGEAATAGAQRVDD
eukprot:TRINITY_DN177_c0_g1_i2.p4 TRINITY_DN177_c0_g1~~TRINITY_DN177_c0_g1_i2.p4  ORF type:complete len:178 (-),score=31.45 TRINITY_DN177_c0_g1_i2:27-560(-)